MANVSSNNLTTLYSGGGVNIRPTSAYGNSNVVALLNAGTDGGNTVTNIVATGNLTIGNITANGNVTADYFIGNLVGNVANANYANFAGNLINGTSNVNTNGSGGNITISVGGNANVLNVTGTHAIASNLKISANSFALGNSAGGNTQGINSVALGALAGNTQGDYGVALGSGAGLRQGNYTISIGRESARGGIIANSASGTNTVAIGTFAGHYSIGDDIVAIGQRAKFGSLGGGNQSIGIGSHAGFNGDNSNTIAIGAYAGYSNIGTNSIAIGANAGYTSLANNSIVLNATGSNLDQTTANTFTVKPVRNVSTPNVMFYNNTTGEITYDVSSSISNGTSNVSIPVANGNINFSTNGVANVVVIDTNGNLNANVVSSNLYISPNVTTIGGNAIDLQFKIDNVLDTSGHYYIDSDGYYFTFSDLQQDWGQNGGSNISGFTFDGETTSGSNVITNVTLYDSFQYDIYDLDSMSSYLVGQYFYTNQVGVVNDGIFPVLTKITAVDTATATITVDQNALSTQSFTFVGYTGVSLSDSTKDNYRIMSRAFMTTALSTNSTGNIITCYNASIIADNFINTPIVFSGTGFGNITPNQTYWVLTADGITNEITISDTQGGPEVALTTATGLMNINSELLDLQPIALTTGFYFAGPYPAVGLAYGGYTVDPDPNFSTDPTIVYSASTNSTDFNIDNTEATHYTRVDNGLVIGPDVTNTLTGKLSDQFVNGGLTVGHSGLSTQQDPGGGFPRADMRIINYTNNGSDSASILSPGNPPSIGWSTFTGNVNTTLSDQYLRNGRIIGRLTWSARSETGQNAGSRPPASIQVQALGNWTGNTMPMGMYMQYTPISAGGTNNVDKPRTWLGAANNTTRLSGATNVQIGPLKTDGNAAQQRALSGVSSQTWVDISGYVQGSATSNGQGSLVNVTTIDAGQNGNVALRLSRNIGNTGNMEFVLPVASANTMTLVDNASGNTIATFTNGDVKMANATIDTNGFMKFSTYTAANLLLITGSAGWVASVIDSSTKFGRLAYWAPGGIGPVGWLYVDDNSAV